MMNMSDHWIRLNEILPPLRTALIVAIPSRSWFENVPHWRNSWTYYEAFYNINGAFLVLDGNILAGVTHWMIIEPPQLVT